MTGLLRALIGLALTAAVTLAVQLALLSDAEFAPDHSLWIVLDTIITGGFIGVGSTPGTGGPRTESGR